MENWRFIEANSDYMVSDHGRILSFKGKSKLIISSSITAKGYEYVAIRKRGYTSLLCTPLSGNSFYPQPEASPPSEPPRRKQAQTTTSPTSNGAMPTTMSCTPSGPSASVVTRLSPVPCATTDEAGNILQAYPSMNALVKGEQMNPKQRNWLVLHLLHPERLKQSAMKKKPRAERSGSEECFLIAPEIPVLTVKADSIGEFEAGNPLGIGKSSNSVGEFKAGNVCVQPVSFSFVSSPFPLILSFAPIHHSVTQHYYRRLSPEESAIFGFNTYILPRERGQRKEFLQ